MGSFACSMRTWIRASDFVNEVPVLSCLGFSLPESLGSEPEAPRCIGVDAAVCENWNEVVAASRCLRRKSLMAWERIARWSTTLRARGWPLVAELTFTNWRETVMLLGREYNNQSREEEVSVT
jgi:hypothetical protein